MSKHTAGPWFADHLIVSAEVYGHPDPIAMMAVNGGRGDEALANAQFIVRACNAHEDLLAALKALVDWQGVEHQAAAGPDGDAEDCPEDDTCRCPIVAQVNAAIAKAERRR